MGRLRASLFFFFNDTATTEIYTLSLHDALPISQDRDRRDAGDAEGLGLLLVEDEIVGLRGELGVEGAELLHQPAEDRKSTRLNSSHANISYAVFCLKKKKKRDHPRLAPTTHRPL